MRNMLARLREAMSVDPCKKHRDSCPIPDRKGKEGICQWGHTALEFADRECDACAEKFLKALGRPFRYAQRFHHHSRRRKS